MRICGKCVLPETEVSYSFDTTTRELAERRQEPCREGDRKIIIICIPKLNEYFAQQRPLDCK